MQLPCISALKVMQNGKAPDPDSCGSLPRTLTEASITLPLKPCEDIAECGSYRPISLLNCDVKILDFKAFALRLNIHNMISPDQTTHLQILAGSYI